MSKVRVLVVDDAVVIRKILTDALSSDPNIEVAGVAANGKIALQKVPQINPDIITLDVEMPELNGIETLKAIRREYPKLPVIMFSTLTERGAETTLEALSLGASDYCTKPANVGSVAEAKARVKEELLSKIFALTGRPSLALCSARSEAPVANAAATPVFSAVPTQVKPAVRRSLNKKIEIVTLGISTGGPNALADVIPALPGDLGVPIVCVQHMPPLFTKMLADRLNATSHITVSEGQEGMLVEPNHMYIAPGGFHMLVKRKGTQVILTLNEGPPENSCRPAADPLFRSVVELYGAHTLGVVMTGMGHDGVRGCEAIKEAGGTVLIQDKESSVVWGMPGYVAEAGLADKVLPLNEMAQGIVRLVKHSAGRELSVENSSKLGAS